MFVKPKSAGVGWPTPLRNFILTLLWRTTFSCCSILLTILAYVHTFVLRFYDAIPTPPRDCADADCVEKKSTPFDAQLTRFYIRVIRVRDVKWSAWQQLNYLRWISQSVSPLIILSLAGRSDQKNNGEKSGSESSKMREKQILGP